MHKSIYILIIIFSVTMCFSCNSKRNAKFEIVNATNETIDSFQILPDNLKNHYIKINPNSKVTYNIDMTDLPKVDGSYRLSFKSETKNVFIPFGYYTNGYPMESLTKIYIQLDTVLIKPEYKKDY